MTTNPTLEAAATTLAAIPDTIARIRDTIGAAPRGPWQIDVTTGYDRSLFVNNQTHHFTFDVDFETARNALLTLLLEAGRQAVVFAERTRPLVEALDVIAAGPSEPAHAERLEAAAALAKYRSQLDGYTASVSQIQANFADSVRDCEAQLRAFLERQPAGQAAALSQFEVFRSEFEGTLQTVTEQLTVLAPAAAESLDRALQALQRNTAKG